MTSIDDNWTSESRSAIHILLVEDDPGSHALAAKALETAGYEVWGASNGEEALNLLKKRGLPHVALIDIMMPGMNGIEVAHKIQQSIDLPIIMLTSVDDHQTVVDTLNDVAEDYMIKPFHPDELVARIERLLRRIGDFSYTREPQIQVDDRLAVEFAKRRIIVEGETIELTPTENKLLYVLMRNSGRTLLSEYLLKRVWPMEEVYEDTLRTHIYRLRRKIEIKPRKPKYILTRRSMGYSFMKLER